MCHRETLDKLLTHYTLFHSGRAFVMLFKRKLFEKSIQHKERIEKLFILEVFIRGGDHSQDIILYCLIQQMQINKYRYRGPVTVLQLAYGKSQIYQSGSESIRLSQVSSNIHKTKVLQIIILQESYITRFKCKRK